MKNEWLDIITAHMGVQPVLINSADFSAQNRQRYYWSNIPVAPWVPVNVTLREVLGRSDYIIHYRKQPFTPKKDQLKSGCLTGAGGNSAGDHSDMDVICFAGEPPNYRITPAGNKRIDIKRHPNVRRYSVIECERLQTLPDGYTSGISNTQRYKVLGNGWTVDVIAHILRGIHHATV
jgi:DNA (cytosine-5)-methyltransferase 3A